MASVSVINSMACGSLHHGLRLLAQVLREVVEGRDSLARVARALPASEGLITRPCAGRGSLRPVGIGHAGLDVLMKPADLLFPAIEAGGEAEGRLVGELHGMLLRGHAMQHEDRQKHL